MQSADTLLTTPEHVVLGLVKEKYDRDLGTLIAHVVQELGAPVDRAGKILRSLDDQGMTELVPLYDDDGFLRGRGRIITAKGIAWCKRYPRPS